MQIIFQPALPFIPEKDEPKLPSAKERKESRKNFVNEEKLKKEIVVSEEETKIVERMADSQYYDGIPTLIYMRGLIEEGLGWLKNVRTPPAYSDPYKMKEVNKEIEQFLNSGIYILAEEIIDNIENLIVLSEYNPHLFGKRNHQMGDIILEIFGIDQIKEMIKKAKESNGTKESLFWFSKLLNIAARPLVFHEELRKQTIYEPAISDTGLNESMERG